MANCPRQNSLLAHIAEFIPYASHHLLCFPVWHAGVDRKISRVQKLLRQRGNRIGKTAFFTNFLKKTRACFSSQHRGRQLIRVSPVMKHAKGTLRANHYMSLIGFFVFQMNARNIFFTYTQSGTWLCRARRKPLERLLGVP